MNFDYSEKTKEMIERVQNFMDANVYPNIPTYNEQMAARQ